MKNALTAKKIPTMMELLKMGHSCEVVAEWMDVNVDYVISRAPQGTPRGGRLPKPTEEKEEEPKPKAKSKTAYIDPYAHLTKEDLDKVDLKSFRNWVIENMDESLSTFSSRVFTTRVYNQHKR